MKPQILKKRPRKCPVCGSGLIKLTRTPRYVHARWAVACENLNCNWVATSKSSEEKVRGE